MTRLIGLLAAGLALAFAAFLAAAHAQPTDDDLRIFLPPDDCAAPCWEGIQPGVTTLNEAITRLRANPWIERVYVKSDAPFTFLYVDWSQQAPAFAENVSLRLPTYMWVRRNTIQLIVIPTLIPYGEIWSLLGAPSAGDFAVSGYRHTMTPGNRPNTRHTAVYFDGQVTVDTRVFCPVSPALFWNAPVTIIYSAAGAEPRTTSERYDLVQWIFSPPCKS